MTLHLTPSEKHELDDRECGLILARALTIPHDMPRHEVTLRLWPQHPRQMIDALWPAIQRGKARTQFALVGDTIDKAMVALEAEPKPDAAKAHALLDDAMKVVMVAIAQLDAMGNE